MSRVEEGAQAIDRAARILIRLVESDDVVTLSGVMEDTQLPKSTAARLLRALERNGLAQRRRGGGFRPGPVLVEYARRDSSVGDLAALAWPFLERLGQTTGETTNVGIPTPGGVARVAQIDSNHPLGAGNWTGSKIPIHASSMGKVFMAFGAAQPPFGRLAKFGPNTITDMGELAHRPRPGEEPRFRHDVGGARRRPVLHRGARTRLAWHGDSGHIGLGPDRSHVPRAPGRAFGAGGLRGRRPVCRHQPLTRRTRSMTNEEILQQIYDETLVGNRPAVVELTTLGIEAEIPPNTLLFEALIPALEEVGARFERGDFFVPEMLISGRAMTGALELLRPLLIDSGVEKIGTFLMGTVQGDVHDIGKNLVNIMLEGAGFEVVDIGVQVRPETFIEAINEHKPDLVGFSAFLTTTMPMFKANIEAIEKAGLRDDVIIMVGGAPVTQEYADVVGADGYAADASSATKRAKELLEQRRTLARV